MGDAFFEEDNGKKTDCRHIWERDPKTKRDHKHHRNIWFRTCKSCKQEQVGLSWNGYQQHGIDWWDKEEDIMQYLLKRLETQ